MKLNNLKNKHVHFVGIKGTGMAALVEIFFHQGAIITGSDVSERFYTDEILEKLGLKALPFSKENITDDIDFVVYSSAYKKDVNPDLVAAVEKNIPLMLYTEALGEYSSMAFSSGICGVHGKTSTTGLTGTILKELPLPSQTLAGSIIKSFGDTCTYTSPNIVKGEKSYFVAETCEYQRHFMSFYPKKIILTSVESDHQDYYPTYEDIRQAFIDYGCKLPEGGDLIYCADDKGAVETAGMIKALRPDIKLFPYGEKAEGPFHVDFLGVKDECNNFALDCLGELSLKVPGHHEVLDAAAAASLCVRLCQEAGILSEDFSKVKENADITACFKKGLLNFAGGKRRSEIIGQFKTSKGVDVIVMDDYGHHPTAVKTTLDGFRSFYGKRRIIVDFMSHTYSRTQALLTEFAQSFGSADTVILHKIYSSARENPADFNITGKTLFEETKKYHNDVHYYEEILDAKDFLLSELEKPLPEDRSDGILFVTMGAGDNWKIGKEILK